MAEVGTKPISLLEALETGSGFEAALITSFNVYFPFMEEVVLRRLHASGCHYVLALMDGGQLAADLVDRSRNPKGAGRRYGLLPIGCKSSFHPKVALLVGPRGARVLVGSHNLTMSGFIQNREITNVIDVAGPKDREGAAAVVEVIEFCKAWARGLPAALQQALEDFGKGCSAYFGPLPGDQKVSVVGSRPDGPSLWQRVRGRLPKEVKRVVVVGPFFDRELAFVRRLLEDLGPEDFVVGIDPATVSFPGNTTKLPRGVRVVDAHGLNPGRKRSYLHGKAILIEGRSGNVLISGSANPTAAAWLAQAGARNAEMVVIRQLARSEADLGLDQLFAEDAVAPDVLSEIRTRPEPQQAVDEHHAPLVGVSDGSGIVVEAKYKRAGSVVVRDLSGAELSAVAEKGPGRLIITVREALDEAASFEVDLDGTERRGFVHHIGMLREAAVSSSQRRLREALGGLNGDPSHLEGLLRLVEKVIFDGASAGTGTERKQRVPGARGVDPSQPTVEIVASLKKDRLDDRRYLSTGDLGLLLDFLMRKLWQSLSHEPTSAVKPETELIDSDDEQLLRELPTDPEIAEAWHRKSRTLLRRLRRRIEEGTDPVQIVVESAAVLGVLEALRRVEDQDRWRPLRVEFVDREAAADFVFRAVPHLFTATTGLLDAATARTGISFAEQQGLIEWATWLAWLTGFGPTDAWKSEYGGDEDEDESAAATEAAERLACACLIGARAISASRPRMLGLLDASPFPGEDPQQWLDSLTRIGEAFRNPASASVAKRLPTPGDLVLTPVGTGPFIVRCVRGNKVDLIDFGRENETATFLAAAVRVLDCGFAIEGRIAG